MKNIITDGPLEPAPVNGPTGVNSSNIGDALDATPIEGHEVDLKMTREEITSGGESVGDRYK